MMRQYLEQILEDSDEKRSEAAALRGRLGMLAREGDVAVTIVFDEGRVVIEEGLCDPDAVVSGEVEHLLHVLAGRANPAWAIRERRVAIRPGLRRPLLAYRAYHLMRLPGVHVWSGLPRSAVRFVVGAAAVAGIGLVVWRLRRSEREHHA